jgi:DNA-binding LacI/PurR family transcriptional regulator
VTDDDPLQEEALLTSFMSWRPVAVITTGFEHTETTRRMLSSGRIRVAELMDIDEQPIDLAVGLSHRSAGVFTARHLVDLGYRRFGYVGHDWTADRRAHLRYEGLVEGLAERGLSIAAEELAPNAARPTRANWRLRPCLRKVSSRMWSCFRTTTWPLEGISTALPQDTHSRCSAGLS